MAATSNLRLCVITAVSGFALLAAGAAAAQSPSTPRGGGGLGAPSAAAPRPKAPAPDPLKMEDVSKVQGAAVYDQKGNKIGSVSTVLMRPDNKTVDRLVVGEGGILGIGSHKVALPLDAFSWDSLKDGFTLAKTADDLKSMPEWHEQVSEVPGTAMPGNH